jgi:hypothetical protein
LQGSKITVTGSKAFSNRSSRRSVRRAGNNYGRVRSTRVCRASVVRGWASVDPLE